MTVREYIEKNKNSYCEIVYESKDKTVIYGTVNGFYTDNPKDVEKEAMEKNIEDCRIVSMNGCEFYLYVENEHWADYCDMDEDGKESIRSVAAERYGYAEDDKFIVLFG